MTRINRLVLKGFKSFANHTELVFGPGFNCILGPNGSGKSNILDALTFVLGRTSSKAMRAEKASNLIYNGSKKSEPAKEAMVSIAFDNSNKIFPVNAGEVVVTRTVHQNGNSTYRLNGKKTVRKDIVDLLSIARINPDGHNVILQGDIIQFVEMSTIERRQLVEEIAGIGAYEDKKKKSLSELQRVEERLKEADIVLSERKAHLKELKNERDHALEFKGVNGDLQTTKASLLKRQISEKQNDIQKNEDNEKSYSEKIAQLNAKKDEIKKNIEENKAKVDSINKEIEIKGEKEQIDLNRTIEQLKVDIATNKTKLESHKNEIERIGKRKLELEENTKTTTTRIKQLKDEKESIEKEIKSREKDMQSIEKSIVDFKKRNKFDEDSQKIEDEIEKLEKESEEKQLEIQKLREEQQSALREKDKIELFIQNIEDQVDKLAQIKKENSQQLDELKQKRQRFKAVSSELQKYLDEHSSIAEQLGSERQKKIALTESIAKLRAQNISVTEKMSSDLAIRSILEQKNKIKGIYGTVSELGQVDKKFSMALEIAAGNRIKSIVVENDQVASDCIDYLKKNRLGVATFLPLSKLKSRLITSDVYDLAKKPGVHGLAINLVSFDERFQKAFSHVFGDTLVVENIDVARKIGIGNARMVTIDGDLAETSGAMVGGYRQKRTGIAFIEKDVMKEIHEQEEALAKLEDKVRKAELRQKDLDSEITRLRAGKANLEGEVITLEKMLHIKSDEADDFGSAKTKLIADQKAVDKKIDDAQNQISALNKQFAEIKIKKQELRNKINEMRKPEVIAELRAFEDKKTQLKEEIIKLNGELNNFNMQIDTMLGPEVKKTIEILKNIEKEEEKFKEIAAELKKKVKEDEQKLKDGEENALKFRAKYRKMFEQKSKLDKEIQELEKNVAEEDFKVRGVEERVNDLRLRKAASKGELAGLEKEFEEYVNVSMFDEKSSIDELKLKSKELERKKISLGNVNFRALEVYETIEKEYLELEKKKATLGEEKEDVLELIGEIEEKKKKVFLETFEVVNSHFKSFFEKLSKKGEGFLELENPENLFEAGIEIKVRITGNKFLDIKSLSGGEKTLTALAFIFSIQEHEPASFYVLDEVDAALDKHNSEKLAQLVRSYCAKAQYIIISHNDSVIAEADKLYGISMGDHGRSNVTTLEL